MTPPGPSPAVTSVNFGFLAAHDARLVQVAASAEIIGAGKQTAAGI